ncbi:uncharacterized protein ZBAI_03945 [Zygosaccharomyces bailii ISA1307]|nr:uncharacterized protein ZBAI_03945 [Zygosaccharomyces bailii ISA1307]
MFLNCIFNSTTICEPLSQSEFSRVELQPSLPVYELRIRRAAHKEYFSSNKLQSLVVILLMAAAAGTLIYDAAKVEYKGIVTKTLKSLKLQLTLLSKATLLLPIAVALFRLQAQALITTKQSSAHISEETLDLKAEVGCDSDDDAETDPEIEQDMELEHELASNAEQEVQQQYDLPATWRTQRKEVGLPYQDLTMSKSTALSLLLWDSK